MQYLQTKLNRILTFALPVFILGGCLSNTRERTTLPLSAHPEGKLSAEWLEVNMGATTPYSYKLYIHDKSKTHDYSEEKALFVTNSIENLEVTWQSPNTLQIRCVERDVYHWTNQFWRAENKYRIEMDSACNTKNQFKWAYIAPGTPAADIPLPIRNDTRILPALTPDKSKLKPDVQVRSLANADGAKYIIVETTTQ